MYLDSQKAADKLPKFAAQRAHGIEVNVSMDKGLAM